MANTTNTGPKVANNKIINKLSRRSLKANRRQNIVAIIAIALTSILFTTLFTIGGGILSTMEKETQLMVGTSAHAGLKRLTQEEYDRFVSAPSVRDISYNIYIAVAENEELRKRQTEIRYSEDEAAKWGFSEPTTGRMPEAENEVAMNTLTLDALGIPYRLGEEIPLSFTVNGTYYEEIFILCGYWVGNPVMHSDQVWLARTFVDKVAPMPDISYLMSDFEGMEGYINADVWFSSSFDIEGKAQKLLSEVGYTELDVDIGINWAYQMADIDPMMILIIAIVLILILLSGYLIIYNIFTISVERDTHFYGLLKTIGATGKHIRRIVLRQALILSCTGIPIGLVIGFILGNVLTPVIFSASTLGAEAAEFSANPLIFVFSAVFSLITVSISTSRPGLMAARVSLVEAVKYTGVSSYKGKRMSKRSKSVSPVSMAFANLQRYPKKIVAVTLSLALSLILLGGVYSAVGSFDMEKYVSNQIVTDFSMADATVYNIALSLGPNSNYEGITDDFISELSMQQGVIDIAKIYFKENMHQLTDEAYENAMYAYEQIGEQHKYSMWEMQNVRDSHTTPFHIYGINSYAAVKMEMFDQTIDYEKLSSGDYAYVSTFTNDGDDYYSYYAPDDKIMLDIGGGITKEYTVIDYAQIPTPFTCQHGHLTEIEVYLAEPQFMELYGETDPMVASYDVEPTYIPAMEEWAANYCAYAEKNLSYISRATYEEEFRTLSMTFLILGGATSFILALVGLLNFFNSITTSILSRRRELGMLQSVGMTFRQLQKMLVTEGLSYIGFAVVFTLTIGLLLMRSLAFGLAGEFAFFTWNFSLAPVFISILVMLFISVGVTLGACRGMRKESLIDRLKEE